MNIIIARTSGYCFGVKRAINQMESIGSKAHMYGPVIHNPQMLKHYENRGINVISNLEELESCSTVVIRAHGVPRSKIEEAKKFNLKVIDATCPYVTKEQNLAKQYEQEGYQVVVVGESHHAEIKGVVGNLKNAIVVDSLEQAKKLGNFDKIGVVVQTTHSRQIFDDVANELKNHCKEIIYQNTICYDTRIRQETSVELAKKVDIMIVIGGKMSSNTARLAKLCSEITQTYHTSDASELKEEWFANKKNVGINGGASTPDFVVNEVVERIKGF